MELATNAEYESAWCVNQEKLYLRSKFFGQKLRGKNSFEIGK